MANKYINWLIFGALTGLVLGLIAPWLIGMIADPTGLGIEGITFSTYKVREELTSIAGTGNQVATWAAAFIGVTIPGQWWVVALISAAGLGAAVAVVAWLYDLFLGKILEMIIPAKHKLITILILAHVLVGIAIQNNYPEFAFVSLLFLLLTGILSIFIMRWVYKLTRMQLPA